MMEPIDLHELTARELEVLRLMMTGATNGGIAISLGISVQTLKNHVTHILLKLSAPCRLTAVIRALQLGIIELPASPVCGVA